MKSHLRKWVAAGAAVAAIGGFQIATSGSAQAYTGALDGTAVCAEDGSIRVDWVYTVGTSIDVSGQANPGDVDIVSPLVIAATDVPAGTVVPWSETYASGTPQATTTVTINFTWNYTTEPIIVDSLSKTIDLPSDCEPPPPSGGEWCSPGYWRQPHHLDSWAATGYSTDDSYNAIFGASIPGDPTLLEILQSPQIYNKKGAGTFNAVGDLLSGAHPDVDFDGTRVEDSCPLN